MAIWPIFRVARSSRTDQSMLVARVLKIGQIADGGMPPTYIRRCTRSESRRQTNWRQAFDLVPSGKARWPAITQITRGTPVSRQV